MDEMKTVAELRRDPAPISDDAVRAARRALYGEMRRPARRGRVPVLRTAVAGGIAVALAAGIAAALTVGGESEPPPPAVVPLTDVQLVVRQAALSAEATPEVPLTPRTWTYVKEVIRESDGAKITAKSKRTVLESWTTADGARDANARGKILPDHSPMTRPGLRLPTPAFLIGAPTDPAGMRARVYAEVDRIKAADKAGKISTTTALDPRQNRDTVAYELIGQVLRQFYVPPRQQAALYAVLSFNTSVKVLPDAVDAAGRHGTAFYRVDEQGIRHEVIIDARTYRYLGSRDIFVRDWTEQPPPPGVESDYRPETRLHMKKGDVIGWSAKLESGIVAGPGKRP